MTQIGHIAYHSMRLDETNTNKPRQRSYLDSVKSYWRKRFRDLWWIIHDDVIWPVCRVVKNPGFLVFCPWVMGFCPKNGFLGFLVFFGGFYFSSNLGLQWEFIHAITKSNYSLKTTKQLSATYKPNLKHIGHKNISMWCTWKILCSIIYLHLDMRHSLWDVNNTCSSQLIW